MPTYNHNVSYGLQYGDLPEYLAVSMDGEMFTVTNTRELSACSDIGNQWLCPIARAFQWVMTSSSCVMALFKNDPKRKHLCSHTLTSNKGIYSVYLGGRKWLYSGSRDMDITYICPESKTNKRGSVIIKKTAVIKVPRGYAVRTRDWIVPPIIQTKTITTKIATNDQNLLRLRPWSAENQTASRSKDEYFRHKLLDKVSTQLETLK